MSNLVLIGFMGSGKSTAGRILAARLEREFVDTDIAVEERSGKSIQRLFEEDGEAHFRELEGRVIESVCARSNQVISVGGGAILTAANVERLRRSGRVVYLRLSEEELIARTANLKGRPLLEEEDRAARVRELLAQRRDLYEASADEIVDVDAMRATEVADVVAGRLGLE